MADGTGPTLGRKLALVGIAAGHFIVHCYQQTFFIVLPEIARDLSLSPVQIGAITGVRQIAGGAVNLPAGFLADAFRRRTSILLAISMAWIGLAYVMVGTAHSYPLVLLGIALVGMGGATWHPPAMGTLSRLWADRRGLALSLHGVGGSIGDTVAPLAVGAILLGLQWRNLLQIAFVPAVLFALVVAWGLRKMHSQKHGQPGTAGSYLKSLRGVPRSLPFMALLLASGLRTMGQMALLTFLPIYFREDLGYSTAVVGVHLALLTVMGMGSQPVLGFLSDRLGRKAVLVPGLTTLSLLTLLLVWAEPGIPLIVVVILLGVFIYSLNAIVMALAMDITRRDLEGTTVGLLFASNFILGGASPVIAGAVISHFQIKAAFVYVAAVYLAAALLIGLLPVPQAKVISET